MKKSFMIKVDCANCANKIEQQVAKMDGISSANVNFLFGKMNIEFAEGVDWKAKMEEVISLCKKIEPDFEIIK